MIVGEKVSAVRNGVYLGGIFFLTDIVFFIVYWLSARGYVEVQFESRMLLAKVWNITHSSTNDVFGPNVFTYFKYHADDWSTLLGMLPYLVFCFLQVFIEGFLLGFIVTLVVRLARK